MKIFGIDPGTTSIGYAVLEVNTKPYLLASGLVRIKSRLQEERLKELFQGLNSLFSRWKPEAVAVEELFFCKNAKTARMVSEARGVILLTTSLAGLTVYEYTPLEVKKIVAGYGRANKAELEKIIRLTMLEVKNINSKDDIFDAIAIALTCFFKERGHNFKK